MNTAALRYRVTQFLNGLSQPAAIGSAELMSAVPGEPLVTEVTIKDPYTPGTPERRFRITFEELDT